MRTRSLISIILIIAIIAVLVMDIVLYIFNGGVSSSRSPSSSSVTSETISTEVILTAPIEPTTSELYSYFEAAYTVTDAHDEDLSFDEMCEIETDQVRTLLSEDGYSVPSNLDATYQSWREEEHPYTEPLFEKTDITMYTTSALNIRESYTTESDIIGYLESGEAVIIIGIGQGEADGWYQIELTDQNRIAADQGEDENDEDNVGYVVTEFLSETQ